MKPFKVMLPGTPSGVTVDNAAACRALAAKLRAMAEQSSDDRLTPSLSKLAEEYGAMASRLLRA